MSETKRVVIAGGSGFVGKALQSSLEDKGYEVVVLSRREGSRARWDGEKLGEWAKFIDGAFAVINLAGETVAQKWTMQAMTGIEESRVKSSRVIGEAVRKATVAPEVWLNASAIGVYGSRGDEVLNEESKPGSENDFMPRVCLNWESEARSGNRVETRLIFLRIGIVLERDGGAFLALYRLTKAFLGGAPGDGKQWLSWIHRHDLVKMIIWAIENPGGRGVYNACAPNPVRYQDFCSILRSKMGRPFSPNIPGVFLKIGTLLGAPDASLLLDSTRVEPQRALSNGFEFDYPELELAIEDLVKAP